MVEKRDCSFCGSPIEPGTGLLYIKRDGTRYHFCSSKCRRNLLDLGRVPRTVKWTQHYIKGLGKASAAKGKKAPFAPAAPMPAPASAGPGGATGGATEVSPTPEKPAKPAKPAKAPKAPAAKK